MPVNYAKGRHFQWPTATIFRCVYERFSCNEIHIGLTIALSQYHQLMEEGIDNYAIIGD